MTGGFGRVELKIEETKIEKKIWQRRSQKRKRSVVVADRKKLVEKIFQRNQEVSS